MFNQFRIYRVFQLVNFLRAKPSKSVTSMMQYLDTSERTVYRYMDLLKELGFTLERDHGNRWSIISQGNTDIMPFSPQEADYVEKLIKTSGKQNKLAQSVLSKIKQSLQVQVSANLMFKAHLGQIVEALSVAIMESRQVMLRDYTSANSLTVSDRLVEPMCFTENYEAISAFEVKSKQNKYFNIERIGSVEVLETPMKYEPQHEFYRPDIFGFQGKAMNKEIEIELNLRACLVLKEEFPMSMPFIQVSSSKDRYLLKANVQSYLAPGRFVLGLPKDTKVIGSAAFLKYTQKLKNP
jgi:proteasome accessory factor C